MVAPDLSALEWPRRTGRLLLRPATLDDVDAIHGYRSRPDFARYVSHDPLSRDDVVARVQERMDRGRPGARKPGLGLAVEERSGGRLVGDVMLMVKPSRTISVPVDAWEGVIGYGLHPDVHGQGYAAEVAAALLRLGFDDLGLRRIRADAMTDNAASNRVLEKIGMRLEATEREACLGKDGRWLDVSWWAILRGEWLARGVSASGR